MLEGWTSYASLPSQGILGRAGEEDDVACDRRRGVVGAVEAVGAEEVVDGDCRLHVEDDEAADCAPLRSARRRSM